MSNAVDLKGGIDFKKHSPKEYADSLAETATAASSKLLKQENETAQQRLTAVGRLESGMKSFQAHLDSFRHLYSFGRTKSVLAFTTTVSNPAVMTAKAAENASPGQHRVLVEQVASMQQLALPAMAADGITVNQGEKLRFTVGTNVVELDFDSYIQTGDHAVKLTGSQLAQAINSNAGTRGLVTAMVINANGQSQVLLSAAATGKEHALVLEGPLVPGTELSNLITAQRELVPAQDAIIHFGGPGGIKMEQSSNTFDGIPGLSFTVSQAMNLTDAPLVISVARDVMGTTATVQRFVDECNKLLGELNQLTEHGEVPTSAQIAENNIVRTVTLAQDSSVRSLKANLNRLLRDPQLIACGIRIERTGIMTLDSDKLAKMLEKDPDAVHTLFSGTGNQDGLIQKLSKQVKPWFDSATGYFTTRRATEGKKQKLRDEKQILLTRQHKIFHDRYLKQFSALKALQGKMEGTLDMMGLFDTGGGRK